MTSSIPATHEQQAGARRRTGQLVADAPASAGSLVAWRYLPWVIGGVGVILRVGRYLHERSLWLDEAQLALNIMSHSYGELFGKLDFGQGAPVGFLLLEKLTISALGDSERAFRLFPLLAGLASVFVFWRVALRFAGREAALLAMAFFAVLGSLIFYSAETKPYSFDVLTALVLLWLFDRAFTSGRSRDWAVFALVGIAAPWFSLPSVFVLTATGTLLLLPAVLRRNWRLVALNCLAIAAWTVSFAVEYVKSIRQFGALATGALAAGTSEGGSVVKNVYVIFAEPGALPRTLVSLTAFLVVIGAVVLGRTSWHRFGALALTTVTAMLVAQANHYPLEGRWELFLLPLATLLLALGGVLLVRSTPAPINAVVALAVGFLLLVPTQKALRETVRLPATEAGTPSTLQPAENLLARLVPQWRSGDTLYVSVKSQAAFRYYLTCHDCNRHRAEEARLWRFRPTAGPFQESPAFTPLSPSLVHGTLPGSLQSYRDDFHALHGKPRVWFLFTHTSPIDERALEELLNGEGHQLATIREGTAVLLLYDLRS
jgi:dolichyl-phosphate-mannose-protein mannosyltransferase